MITAACSSLDGNGFQNWAEICRGHGLDCSAVQLSAVRAVSSTAISGGIPYEHGGPINTYGQDRVHHRTSIPPYEEGNSLGCPMLT